MSAIRTGVSLGSTPSCRASSSRELQPGAAAAVDAVIQTRRRAAIRAARAWRGPRRARRSERPCGPRTRSAPRPPAARQGCRDAALHRPRPAPPEQALDAQHVRPRRVDRKPFAEQLRCRIDAERIRPIRLRYRACRRRRRTRNRCCSGPARRRAAGRASQRAHREGVDVQRVERVIFRRVDVVVRRRS